MNGNHIYPSKDPINQLRQEMKLRNFSPKTVKSYCYYITNCIEWSSKSAREIGGNDVRAYLERLAQDHSASTLNTAYSALQKIKVPADCAVAGRGGGSYFRDKQPQT